MARNKSQTDRLTTQHTASKGVEGIFGELARNHDLGVGEVATKVMEALREKFPMLEFHKSASISKSTINKRLHKIDNRLGHVLFVSNATIRPDGGIIEVKDDNGEWRIVLVAEAKYQGKDVENIKAGLLVGTNGDQDTMAAGNAIERSHKNIKEIANYMLDEQHFPYVLFLEGSNFLTETIEVPRPDGRMVKLEYNSSSLNRIDRLTAANYSMPINTNLCENISVTVRNQSTMLQAASIYTEGRGQKWDADKMAYIMLDIAETSIRLLASDLFNQMTGYIVGKQE